MMGISGCLHCISGQQFFTNSITKLGGGRGLSTLEYSWYEGDLGDLLVLGEGST